VSSIDDDRRHVVERMKPYDWSDQESVGYEAALEAINGLVGAYSARITAERAKPTPDLEAIARWRDERAACADVRRALSPTDHDEVARVRRDYPLRARSVLAS
jgi:hypothetical protein